MSIPPSHTMEYWFGVLIGAHGDEAVVERLSATINRSGSRITIYIDAEAFKAMLRAVWYSGKED